MEQKKIDRINELAKKSKTVGLTAEEAAEQKVLRAEYVAAFRAMGGLLAPGTDAGAWAVPHGSMTEEGYLAEAGADAGYLEKGTRKIMEKF